ncbi:MAG: hypothetical protein ACREVL_16520 [Solimonas sp.]
MNVSTLWTRLSGWVRPPSPARALAASINSVPADALIPSAAACTLIPAPTEISIQVYRHGGRLFERLTPERQEQAQRELYLRLKAKQRSGPQFTEDRWSEMELTDE